MFKMADVLYAALTVFQGYCLQYFLGQLSGNKDEGQMERSVCGGLICGPADSRGMVFPAGI